jgi:hypothetical protein
MMTVGDRLQAADVGVGVLSLLVTSISAYLTWNVANGMPLLESHPAGTR